MSFFTDPTTHGGKKSMARLIAFMLACAGVALALALIPYLFLASPPRGEIIVAVASVESALVAAGCVAIVNRVRGKPDVS